MLRADSAEFRAWDLRGLLGGQALILPESRDGRESWFSEWTLVFRRPG